MKIRLFLSLLLCFSMLFCTSCKGGTNSDSDSGISSDIGQSGIGDICLPFDSADSLNPYAAKTKLNKTVCQLLFDPLFYLNDNYETVCVLAESVDTVGDICTVRLKSVNFSDGSTLSANDIVYSFNAAKNSGGRYAVLLSSIVSAEARDDQTVIFKNNSSDPYVKNLLTFPIFRSGTDKLKDADNVELVPVGCGKFTVNEEKTQLIQNPNWHGGELKISTIKLQNTPDTESLSHAIETNTINMYYTDLSDCNIPSMSGSRTDIVSNTLVYLGVNYRSDLLSNSVIRHAISLSIDRNKLCSGAYFNTAVPANGIYNPNISELSKIQSILPVANSQLSIENLNKIGYNSINSDGYLVSQGNELAIRLLVNSENRFKLGAANMIVSQLESCGIHIILESVPYTQYVERLSAGNFDLYLAEVNISDNMDMRPLLTEGGSVAYGIVNTVGERNNDGLISLQKMFGDFYSVGGQLVDIAATAVSELPVIPLCYKTGALLYSGVSVTVDGSFETDLFAFLKK